MKVKKTPLNEGQLHRLYNVVDIDEQPLEVNFVEFEGVSLTKVEVKYPTNHEESIFLTRKDYDFVKNGINVWRD